MRTMQFYFLACATCLFSLQSVEVDAANWITAGGSAQRFGVNPDETILTPSTVQNLVIKWETTVGGSSTAQPLFLESVPTLNGTHNEVYETNRTGWVFALNAASGVVDWSRQLPVSGGGPSCEKSGLGVPAAPTIDPAAGLLYMMDAQGDLHALNVATGSESAGYPVPIIDSGNLALGAHSHTSPTLVGNTIYIGSSAAPDCEAVKSPLYGGLASFDTPSLAVTNRFFSVGKAGGGGGIWGPGGASVDPVTGNLLAATGNAYVAPDYTPLAESVIELNANLNVLQSDSPRKADFRFKGDDDFGSTPVPLDMPRCPRLLAVLNKIGTMFIYSQKELSAGPLQKLRLTGGILQHQNPYATSMVAFDAATGLMVVNNPIAYGSFTNGAIAFLVPSRPACTSSSQVNLAWQTTFGNNEWNAQTRATQPTIAGGLVWFATGSSGSILALNETTGAPEYSTGSKLTGATLGSPTVADGRVYFYQGQKIVALGLRKHDNRAH